MSLRSSHGKHRGKGPRIEVGKVTDLPAFVPDSAGPVEIRRTPDGRPADAQSQRALASLGGRARAESVQLGKLMGLIEIPEGHGALRYIQMAKEWRDQHMQRLASEVGNGVVGPGPAAILSTAALQLAASRMLFDHGILSGDTKSLDLASRFGDQSRQNTLASYELVAKEAQARPQGNETQRIIDDMRARAASSVANK